MSGRVAVAVVIMAGLALTLGCSGGPGSTDARSCGVGNGDPSTKVSTDGPIAKNMNGRITEASSEPAALVVYRDDLYLGNTGTESVCLDAVELGRPQPPATVPLLLGTFVASRPRDFAAIQLGTYDRPGGVEPTPLPGFTLRPHLTVSQQPAIVLKLRAGSSGVSYNEYVLLAYHDLSGQRYVVVYPMRYLMCVRGKAPAGCEQEEPP